MSKDSRASRAERIVSPHVIDKRHRSEGAWYETPEEIEAGLRWGAEKAELLRWVRRVMGRRLTKRERRCIELYFFKGMTMREAGEATKTNASSVQRAINRGLKKLRAASTVRRVRRKVQPDPEVD
ncbi:MAG TPA: sigma-70 family RNA polymerase sigma factor [Candidatus Hydrogenedentes bacterium]|nr:sigma-70 family RNA polymerase sigma factor [Candidatus Hydrogenedentota bacterium]HRK35314.1 sigma-70 family RNA polymerase sigma factor [Candidatus Hydrogenedentota bacterium]